MTPSEVEKLAREAGCREKSDHVGEFWEADIVHLTRFAELIERAAMEKAAKEADHWQALSDRGGPGASKAGAYIAAAIRAVAQKGPTDPVHPVESLGKRPAAANVKAYQSAALAALAKGEKSCEFSGVGVCERSAEGLGWCTDGRCERHSDPDQIAAQKEA